MSTVEEIARLYDEARDARTYAAYLERVIGRAVDEIDRATESSNHPWLAVLRVRERLVESVGGVCIYCDDPMWRHTESERSSCAVDMEAGRR